MSGDYTLSSNTKLTIAAGSTASSGTVSITGVDNDVDAPNKEVTVSGVASGGNGVTNPADQTLTIEDDEATPTVSLGLSPASIGEDGGVSTVTASLSGASSAEVIVTVSASPVNPAVSGDYTLSSNTKLTIAAGSTASSGTVTITANDNDVDTANKTVTVSGAVSGGNGVTNPANQTLTIEDDDERGLELSAETVTVTEAAAGRTAKYTVVLSTQPTAAVTVAVSSGEENTATVTPGSLTFSTTNWKTKQTVTVTGVDDAVDNASDRTTTISHTAGGGDYGSESGKVAVTVTDDEDTPTVSLALSPASIGEDGGVSTVTASLSGASSAEVIVTVSAAPVDPAVSGDYTLSTNTKLTIAAGSTASSGTVSITGVDNDVDAPNKEVTVSGVASGGQRSDEPGRPDADDRGRRGDADGEPRVESGVDRRGRWREHGDGEPEWSVERRGDRHRLSVAGEPCGVR